MKYRKMLEEYIDKKVITYKKKWKDFVQIIKKDERFTNMVTQ